MADDVRISLEAVDAITPVIDQIQTQLKQLAAVAAQVGGALNSGVGKGFEGMGASAGKAGKDISASLNGSIKEVQNSVTQLGQLFTKALTDPMGAAKDLGSTILGALGPIGGAALTVAGTLGGVAAAVIAIGMKGSQINEVTAAFEGLSGGSAMAAANLKALQDGTEHTVSSLKLMETSNRLLSAGAVRSAADLGTLAEAAKALGHRYGEDTMQVMESFGQSLLRGSDRALKLKGITVDLDKAQRDYAATMGLYKKDLTPTMELEAKRIAMLEALRKEADRLGPTALSFAEKIEQIMVSISGWTSSIAKAVAASPVLADALDRIQKAWARAFGDDSKTLSELIVKTIEWLAEKVSLAIEYILNLKTKVEDLVKAWDRLPEPMKKTAEAAGALGGSMFLLSETTAGLVGVTANVAQIWGTWMASWAKGSVHLGATIEKLLGFKVEAKAAGEALANLSKGVSVSGEGLVSMGKAAGLAAVAMAAIAASLYLIYKYWDDIKGPVADVYALWSDMSAIISKFSYIKEAFDPLTTAWKAAVQLKNMLVDVLGLHGKSDLFEKTLRAWYDWLFKAADKAKDVAKYVGDVISFMAHPKPEPAPVTTSVGDKTGQPYTQASRAMPLPVVPSAATDAASVSADESAKAAAKAAAKKQADDLAEMYKQAGQRAYDAMAESFRIPMVDPIALFHNVFAGLNEDTKAYQASAKKLVAQIDQLVAAHEPLKAEEKDFYFLQEARVRAEKEAGVQSLRNQGITEKQIATQLANGASLASLAIQYGVTVEELSAYREALGTTEKAELAHAASQKRIRDIEASMPGAMLTAQAKMQHDLTELDFTEAEKRREIEKQFAGDSEEIAAARAQALTELESEMAAQQEKIAADGAKNITLEVMDEEKKQYDFRRQIYELTTTAFKGGVEERVRLAQDELAETLQALERERVAQTRSEEAIKADEKRARDLAALKIDLAQITSDNIVRIMNQEGVESKKQAAERVKTEREKYEAMVQSAEFSSEQIYEAHKKLVADERALSDNLSRLWVGVIDTISSAMDVLANNIGGAMARIGKTVGSALSAIKSLIAARNAGSSIGELATAGLSSASGIVGDATQGSTAGAAVSGALSGASAGLAVGTMWTTAAALTLSASLGAATMGIGAVVGAAVAWIMSVRAKAAELRKANAEATASVKELEKSLLDQYGTLQDVDAIGRIVGVDLAAAWGDQSQEGLKHFTSLMEDFTKRVNVLMKTVTTGAGVASQQLIDIMYQFEGSTGDAADKAKSFFLSATKDAASGLESLLGGLQASANARYQKILENQGAADALAEAEAARAEIIENSNGKLSAADEKRIAAYDKQIAKLRELSKDELDLAAVEKERAELSAKSTLTEDEQKRLNLLNDQYRALKALAEAGGDVSKVTGDLVITQRQANGLSDALVGTFSDLLARGTSFKDAIAAVAPSLATLKKSMDASGVGSNEAFDFLSKMANMAADSVQGPLVDSIEGAHKALTGLHASGLLTQSMFTGIVDTAMQAHDEIVNAGGDGDAALAAMQPTLQTIWQLQQQFGYEVDASTQKLIDQAEKAGIVGEKQMSAADRTARSMDKVATILEAMAKAMGVIIPKAAQDMAAGVNDAFNDIPDEKNITVKYNYENSGFNPDSGDGSPTENPTAEPHAAGYVGTRPHLALISEGHEPEIVAGQAFMQRALTGAIQAVQQSHAASAAVSAYTSAFVSPNLSAANLSASHTSALISEIRGLRSALDDQSMAISINGTVIEARQLRAVTEKQIGPFLVSALRRNSNGLRTSLKRATE
jgi:hypothetical protein